MRPCLLFLLCLLCCLRPASADLPPWIGLQQGKFVQSIALDAQGRVWVGTEDHGVWVTDPAAPTRAWAHFGPQDGLAEDSATALVCDPKGRMWVGHLRQGVSVFNGQSWKNYDAATGPLGDHVFALAVSPKDGDVWIATEAGLTRYSQSKDRWQYYTQADGLPANQAQALAFDKNGMLYVGMQCAGLAVGAAADEYATWQHFIGPTRPAPTPSGGGFPDCRINALLVAHDGSVYAGTPSGLAGSQDSGKTWHYLRGADWLEKAQGSAVKAPMDVSDTPGPTLTEDWVTALGEDGAGRLWIGHRAKGVEVFDPSAGRPVAQTTPPVPKTDDVAALLAGVGQQTLIGGYGSGLALVSAPDTTAPAAAAHPISPPAPLPSPAAPPTAAELKTLLAAVPAGKPALKPGEAALLGDDWLTQGDWVGRYGRQYAVLCGMDSGMNIPGGHTVVREKGYDSFEQIGPHHKTYNGVYTYIAKRDTPDRRLPYSPLLGYRRDSEVNDGSWDETKYPETWEGPDLWITFTVPSGLHRASFYFVNNDGHNNTRRWRDYLLELKADKPTPPDPATMEAEDAAPTLASTRVSQFFAGVYKKFLVQGPDAYHLKIGRSYSSCTKLQGIFLDQVPDAPVPVVDAGPPLTPPYLGVMNIPMKEIGPAGVGKAGLLVASVYPDSPAAAGGLIAGDILLQADQQTLTEASDLNDLIAGKHVGDTLLLQVLRQQKKITLPIVLQARPADFDGADSQRVQPLPPTVRAYQPPPVPPASASENETITAARALWSALDAALGNEGGSAVQVRDRVLAYRAALSAQAAPALLANWRWSLCLWTDTDRAEFDSAMPHRDPPPKVAPSPKRAGPTP